MAPVRSSISIVLLAGALLLGGPAQRARADDLPAAVRAGLLPADRKNVVLLGDRGVVYASGDAQTDGLAARGLDTAIHEEGNAYRTADGEEFAGPDVDSSLTSRDPHESVDTYGTTIYKDKSTGPYRGVYAKPGNAYIEATVYLPSGDVDPPSVFVDTARADDTPYIYLGGQGSHGGAVDAGLQHSPRKNDWALFLLCSGFGFHYDPGPRFASGQDVTLRFYIPADNYLAVSATGKDVGGEVATQTIVMDVRAYPPGTGSHAGQPTNFGWRADGAGCILKRMTSIAQTHQSFDSGSYSKGVRWRGVRIGPSAKRAHLWTASDEADQICWPDTKHIVIRHPGAGDEVVDILLGSSAPSIEHHL